MFKKSGKNRENKFKLSFKSICKPWF